MFLLTSSSDVFMNPVSANLRIYEFFFCKFSLFLIEIKIEIKMRIYRLILTNKGTLQLLKKHVKTVRRYRIRENMWRVCYLLGKKPRSIAITYYIGVLLFYFLISFRIFQKKISFFRTKNLIWINVFCGRRFSKAALLACYVYVPFPANYQGT